MKRLIHKTTMYEAPSSGINRTELVNKFFLKKVGKIQVGNMRSINTVFMYYK